MALEELPNSSVKALSRYTYKLSGIAYQPMGCYLASMGLMRVINRHVDPEAQFYWQGKDFYINTNTPQSELVEKILASYEAIVIFSPWNNSSGIKVNNTGELSYEGSIEKIANSQSWRTQEIKELLPEFCELIDEYKVGETSFARPKESEKPNFIRQFLNRITHPEWREWADATVILREVTSKQGITLLKPIYPALLGTGGNVSSVDIAENYYSAVCTLFDANTGEPVANAHACLTKAIFGTATSEMIESQEVKALHLFPTQDYKLDYKLSKNNDYAPVGGSSASTVNPALILLATEGLSTFSRNISAINGEGDHGKVIGPPLARYSLAVVTKGASTDLVTLDERKSLAEEYFLPLWSEPKTYPKLKERLFESPLASEEQFYLPKQINDGTDFIEAIQSWAIKNKITGKFVRYAMLPRKGRSNFAVMLELVTVGVDAQRLDLARDLDQERHKLANFARSKDCPALVQGLIYQFDNIFNQFIQGKATHTDLLMELGKLAPIIIQRPPNLKYLSFDWTKPLLCFNWIKPLFSESNYPEFRLALSIASCGLNAYLKESFPVGNVIESLIKLQRQWGVKADKEEHYYARNHRIFASLADINAFIADGNSFDDPLFESWLWALSLIDFNINIEQVPEFEDSQVAFLKLPPAYRLGLIYIKTFERKNSPINAIAHSGDLQLIISRLMGKGIYLKANYTGKDKSTAEGRVKVEKIRRCAAALSAPVSAAKKHLIFKKFFTEMLSDSTTPVDSSEMLIVDDTG